MGVKKGFPSGGLQWGAPTNLVEEVAMIFSLPLHE